MEISTHNMDAGKFSSEWIFPDLLGIDVLVPNMFLVQKVLF
jgi:hypothetical protein